MQIIVKYRQMYWQMGTLSNRDAKSKKWQLETMDNNYNCQTWVDAKSRQLPTNYLHEKVHYLHGTHLQPALFEFGWMSFFLTFLSTAVTLSMSLSRRPVIVTSFPTALSLSSSKVEAMSHIKLSFDRAYIFEFFVSFYEELTLFRFVAAFKRLFIQFISNTRPFF